MKYLKKFIPSIKLVGGMFFWGWIIFGLLFLFQGKEAMSEYKSFAQVFWDLNTYSPVIMVSGIFLALSALYLAFQKSN